MRKWHDDSIADNRAIGQTPPLPDAADARRIRHSVTGVLLPLVSGLLLFSANPPLGWWPLAWVALIPLIASLAGAGRLRQAVGRGYLFGWAFLGPTWYWTGLTIAAWTHSPIGWVAWFGLTAILAGFYGLWGGAAWWVRQHISVHRPLVLSVCWAALWVVMEWLRTQGSLTMPWAQLSYTQTAFLPILQIADLTGAWGVSFLIVLVNASLWGWLTVRTSNVSLSGRAIAASAHRSGVIFIFALVLSVCGYGVWRGGHLEAGRPLTVAAMQGNFDSFSPLSNDRDYVFGTFADLTDRVAKTAPQPPALYVWGESSAPGDALHDSGTRLFLAQMARERRAAVLVGSTIREVAPGEPGTVATREARRESTSLLFAPDGSEPTHYAKRQLVAFGEFIPFRQVFPDFLARAFAFPSDDVTAGDAATLLRFQTAQTDGQGQTQQVTLGPFICYEAMYPRYAREMAHNGANLLVTQSNDSWFQSWAAMQQHLDAVVLRAIENRRDVVRATTTGITCFVDAGGRVTAQAPLQTPYGLVGTVCLREGTTLYSRFGDWFVLACAVCIGAVLWRGRRRKEETDGTAGNG